MFGLQGVLAANYIRKLGAKTKLGLRDSARQGKATGGRCYGYQTNSTTKAIELHPDQAAIVRSALCPLATRMRVSPLN